MIAVRHADEDRQNLLGYIMKSVLERALGDADLAARLGCCRYSVAFEVSRMVSTIECRGEEIVLHAGRIGSPKATMISDVSTLVGLARGASIAGAVLRGRVRVRGNPLRLLPFLPLMRPPPGS